nr:hypothetical protein [Serratia marcescens]
MQRLLEAREHLTELCSGQLILATALDCK